MKNNIIGVLGVLVLVSFGGLFFQSKQLQEERKERKAYKATSLVLLDSIEVYKSRDSLNVASIGSLHLKLSEYEKYRSADYQTIKGLRVDVKRLQSVVSVSSETLNTLQGIAKDTSILKARIKELEALELTPLKAKCIKDNTEWFKLDLCIFEDNSYEGSVVNRESLLVVNHIIPKRFLFFKWGVKDVKNDVVSKNPKTEIAHVESSIFRE